MTIKEFIRTAKPKDKIMYIYKGIHESASNTFIAEVKYVDTGVSINDIYMLDKTKESNLEKGYVINKNNEKVTILKNFGDIPLEQIKRDYPEYFI